MMTPRIFRLVAAALISLVATNPLQAQELATGIGYSDFNAPGGRDSIVLSAEWSQAPFRRFLGGDLSWSFAIDMQTQGDAYAGAGLRLRWVLGRNGFVDAGLMPGLFHPGSAGNNLGGALHFRSLLGLGWRLSDKDAVSLALTHKSNARLKPVNPGLDAVMVRWHRKF